MGRSYVYFIQSGDSAFVKIGSTSALFKRLTTLQIGNPIQLKIIGLIEGERSLEKELHIQFRGISTRGEWFHLVDPLKTYIESLPASLLSEFEIAWLRCCMCGATPSDRCDEGGQLKGYCRRCLMQKDGRLEVFADQPKTPNKPKECSHCGRFRRPLRKGQCSACSEYERRLGVPRPINRDPNICLNCQQPSEIIKAKRCPPCYKHILRQGIDEHLTRQAKECINCHKSIKCTTKDRCLICYNYWRRRGKERPLEYPPKVCSNCNLVVKNILKGRCRNCSNYWNRNKIERPAEYYVEHLPLASQSRSES